jgi:hypothetical protein
MTESYLNDTSSTTTYRFVVDGPKKRQTTTCSLCAVVVMDYKVHALYHFLLGERTFGGAERYQGTYKSGRISITLDHWGREML